MNFTGIVAGAAAFLIGVFFLAWIGMHVSHFIATFGVFPILLILGGFMIIAIWCAANIRK